MKSRFVVYVLCSIIILAGLVVADYLDYRQKGEIIVGPPEGYEEPTIKRDGTIYVEKREVEDVALISRNQNFLKPEWSDGSNI